MFILFRLIPVVTVTRSGEADDLFRPQKNNIGCSFRDHQPPVPTLLINAVELFFPIFASSLPVF